MYYNLHTKHENENPSATLIATEKRAAYKEVEIACGVRAAPLNAKSDDATLLSEVAKENDSLDQPFKVGVSVLTKDSKKRGMSSISDSVNRHMRFRGELMQGISQLITPLKISAEDPIDVDKLPTQKEDVGSGRPFRLLTLEELQKKMVEQEELKSNSSTSERVKAMADHILVTLDKEVEKRMKLVMPEL